MNTYRQVAQKLGVSSKTIQRMVAAKRISIVDLGHRTKRISDAELERVINKNTRRAVI